MSCDSSVDLMESQGCLVENGPLSQLCEQDTDTTHLLTSYKHQSFSQESQESQESLESQESQESQESLPLNSQQIDYLEKVSE